jgi:hypothetical protein
MRIDPQISLVACEPFNSWFFSGIAVANNGSLSAVLKYGYGDLPRKEYSILALLQFRGLGGRDPWPQFPPPNFLPNSVLPFCGDRQDSLCNEYGDNL